MQDPATRRPQTDDRTKLFAALADPTRLQFVGLLATLGDLTASELADRTHVSLALAWHHLQALTAAKVVSRRKSGRRAYYALAAERLAAAFESVLRPQEVSPQRLDHGAALQILEAYPVA